MLEELDGTQDKKRGHCRDKRDLESSEEHRFPPGFVRFLRRIDPIIPRRLAKGTRSQDTQSSHSPRAAIRGETRTRDELEANKQPHTHRTVLMRRGPLRGGGRVRLRCELPLLELPARDWFGL